MPSLTPTRFLRAALAAVVAICTCSGDLAAQLVFGDPATVIPVANSVNVCEPTPDGFYAVNWKTTEAIPEGRFTIPVPDGINFLGGSAVLTNGVNIPPGYPAVSGGQLGPNVVLRLRDPLPAGASGTIEFKLTYDCRVESVFETSYELEVTAESDGGTYTSLTEAINTSASKPVVIPADTTNTHLSDVAVGVPTTREIAIKQTGKLAEAYAFKLCINHGANLSPANQTLEGVAITFPPGDTCTEVSAALYPGLPWPMQQDEIWMFREEVTVTGCDELTSTITTAFGCGPAECQEPSNLPLVITLADDGPDVVGGGFTRVLPASGCVDDPAVFTTTYEVEGRAYDTRFEIRANGPFSYVDSTTIEVDYGTGTFVPFTGDFSGGRSTSGCTVGQYKDFTIRPDPTDAVIDATAANRLVRLRFEVKLCCGGDIGSAGDAGAYGANADLRFVDKCGEGGGVDRDQEGVSLRSSASADVPVYFFDATETFRYDVNDIGISSALRTNAVYCFRFTLPSPLALGGGGNVRWHGPLASDPVVTKSLTDLGGGNYEACFTDAERYGANSFIAFDVDYTCDPAQCGNQVSTSAGLYVDFGGGTCTGPSCDYVLFEDTSPTTLSMLCCPANCDGMYSIDSEIERANYGQPDNDNDGYPDATGALDMNRVLTSRARQGDSLLVSSIASVNTITLPFIEYVTLELSANYDHDPLGPATVELSDISSGLNHTVTATPTVIDARTVQYRLLASDVATQIGDPTFTFGDGDLLRLAAYLATLQNPSGCGIEDATVNTSWFAEPTAFGVGPRLTCNADIPTGYQLVTTNTNLTRQWEDYNSCAGTRYRFTIEHCDGGSSYARPFPYEVRPFHRDFVYEVDAPPGTTLQKGEMNWSRYVIDGDGDFTIPNNTDVTSYFTRVADRLSFDFDQFFTDFTGGQYPNGGYHFRMIQKFRGSCSAQRVRPQATFTARKDYAAIADGIQVENRDFGRFTRLNTPDVRFSRGEEIVEPTDGSVEWNFEVYNKKGYANDWWVAFESPSGDIAPVELYLNGATRTPNAGGVYGFSNLRGGRRYDFRVAADYASCGLDSLIVYTGWTCDGAIPTDLAALKDPSNPCVSRTLPLYLQPEVPEIQQAIIAQPTLDRDACDPLAYSVELLNVNRGVVYEPTFSVIGPSSDGIQTITGSIELAYPSRKVPVDADFVPIGDYDYVVPTANGPKYVWYLDNHVPLFDHTADMGWEGQLAADSLAKRITIRFEAETNCFFERGDYLAFVAEGRAYCGAPTSTSVRNARSVNPQNINLPYDGYLLLDDPGTLDVCNPSSSINLTGSLQYEQPTEGGDTLVFDLPGSLTFGGGTTPDSELDFANATTEIVTGPTGSHERVRVPILAGRVAYERMRFALDLDVDYDSTACGRVDTISGFTTHYFGYDCQGTPCENRDTTSTLAPTPISYRLDSVSVAAFEITAGCDFTDVTVDRLAVTVDNASDATGADIPFAIYIDDGDGVYTPADRLLGSVTLPQNSPAGSTVELPAGPFSITADELCALSVSSDGCTCQGVTSAVTAIEAANAGGDVTACAPDPASVGCGVDNPALGYTYAWAQVAGTGPAVVIDAPNAAQTTITPAAEILDGDEVYTFELTTTGPGACFTTVDRVDVTFTGVVTNAGATIVRCTGFETALDAPDDPSLTGGSWSPTVGLADPTDPATAVTLQAGTTDYYYTYRLPSGCYARYQKRTVGEDCPDLELDKVVTVAPAAVGDPVTFVVSVTNTGADMARGVTVRDLLDPAFEFVSATPGGAYDDATGTWTPIGGNVPPGNTATLELVATVRDSGFLVNVAEVMTLDEDDPDSEPGNGIPTEDDMDGACVALPMSVACGEPVPALTTYAGYSAYQWQRDGVDIPGAIAATYTPDTTGVYSVLIDGGAAPVPTCAVDVFLEECGEIADFVWQDDDGDGIQDVGEPGIEGATVRLYDDATGMVLGTRITDPTGQYRFERVPLGIYYLSFDAATATSPFTYDHSPQFATTPDLDSDPSIVTGQTDTVELSYEGQVRNDVDAGFIPRDELDVDRFDVSLDCDLTTLTIDRIDVRNLGAKPITDDLDVDVYHDANGNGVGDVGETLVATFTLDQDIPIGEARSVGGQTVSVAADDVCRLIAVASGCICNPASSPITSLEGSNAGPNVAGCTPNDLPIGCSPDLGPSGLTFAWSAANPAALDGTADALIADPASPQTTIAPPADLYRDVEVEYVLTTSLPGGCELRDTVLVSFSGIDTTRGEPLSDCVTNDVTLTGPSGFSDYTWTPAAGLSDPSDPGAVASVDFGRVDYRLRYTDAGGCAVEYRQEVTGIPCTDLALTKTIQGGAPSEVGQTVAFVIALVNEGTGGASGVAVSEMLDDALAFERAEPAGEYDPGTGVWSIPGVIAPDQSRELVVYATVVRGGIITNVAEVIASDQRDIDSEHGNGLIDEDDMDALCFAVDFEVPCNAEAPTLRTYPGQGAYQWYRDGAAVPGAISRELTVTEPGRYSVEIDGGLSGYPHACEVDVAIERCVDLGDRVWLDGDGDGIQDAGEPGLPGVAVELYEANTAALVRSAETDADGAYLFRDVVAGSYYVTFAEGSAAYDVPFEFSPRDQGGDDALDSDADPATGRTRVLTLSDTDTERLEVDAGLVPRGELAVVKRVTGYDNLRSGNLVIRFEVGLSNTGAIDLAEVALADAVAEQFGVAFVAVHTAPRVFGGAGVRANEAYDGLADSLLLDAGTVLPAGGELLVAFAVEVDPFAATWPLYNQATARGTFRLAPEFEAYPYDDLSDSGVEYETTNPGEPGDRGTSDDPTEIACAPLGNVVDHDAAEVCLGESLELSSRLRPERYAYEWRASDAAAADSLTEQLRVSTDGGSTYTATPTAALTEYTLWMYNAGSLVCYYDTEAETEVAVVLPPQIITPNNDGANDELRISCLRERRGAAITVFNRWGSPVYHSDDYANDWDGTHDGKPLPVGTYFFVLELPDAEAKPYKGVVAIER